MSDNKEFIFLESRLGRNQAKTVRSEIEIGVELRCHDTTHVSYKVFTSQNHRFLLFSSLEMAMKKRQFSWQPTLIEDWGMEPADEAKPLDDEEVQTSELKLPRKKKLSHQFAVDVWIIELRINITICYRRSRQLLSNLSQSRRNVKRIFLFSGVHLTNLSWKLVELLNTARRLRQQTSIGHQRQRDGPIAVHKVRF